MKVEMIEINEINSYGIGRSDILEVKKEHLEQYKSFYKSFAEMNLEHMVQDNSFLKLTKEKLKFQILKLTERIKLYSSKLSISRDNTEVSLLIHKEIMRLNEKNSKLDKNKEYYRHHLNKKSTEYLENCLEYLNLDKDTNAFWRSKVKELVKERELNKNYLKVLNRFHQTLKRSIYDLEKDIFMKQEENKLNG